MIVLMFPKRLPKATELRVHTVLPDVRLTPRAWVLHHRKVNHVTITLP
jgi:hypothetical protein